VKKVPAAAEAKLKSAVKRAHEPSAGKVPTRKRTRRDSTAASSSNNGSGDDDHDDIVSVTSHATGVSEVDSCVAMALDSHMASRKAVQPRSRAKMG